MAKTWEWYKEFRRFWRAEQRFKHPEVKGEPVGGTGRIRTKYCFTTDDWDEGSRTRSEREALDYEHRAEFNDD